MTVPAHFDDTGCEHQFEPKPRWHPEHALISLLIACVIGVAAVVAALWGGA